MAEKQKLTKTTIQKRVTVTIGGKSVGIVKNGTCTYQIEPGEATELKEEGGAVVYKEVGNPIRTLSFDVYLEDIKDLEEVVKRGDLVLTIEGAATITYADATAVITRKWTSADGGIDHYECTLPAKGETTSVPSI